MARNTASNARLSRNLTDAQLNALLKAHLIDGIKRSELSSMAAAGTLGVPAFTVDYRYVYTLVKRHAEAFELQHPEALARGTQHELIRLHADNLKAARLVGKDSDPGERARIAKALRDTERALNAGQAKAKPEPGTPDRSNGGENDAQPKQRDVVGDLLARSTRQGKAGARSGSLSLAPNPAPPASTA